jgi:thiol reductant ABC exporter CydC subunit
VKTILRLIGFLRPYWGWVVLSIALGVATTASAVGLLGTSAFLIASAALQPSVATLQVAIVGVRFFGITRSLFRYLERLVSHSVNFRLLAKLRVAYYRALEPLAPAGTVDEQAGDLLNTAVRDIETLENFYVRVVAPPVSALIVTMGVCLFVQQYDPAISWVLLAGLALGGVIVPALSFWLNRSAGKEKTAYQSNLRSVFIASIQGLSDLSAFGQEQLIMDELTRYRQWGRRIERRLVWGGAFTSALNLLVINLTLWVILWVSIPLVSSGQMTGVSLAVVCLITLAVFEITAPLGTATQLLGGSLQSARRLFRWMDARPQVQEPTDPTPVPQGCALAIRGLTFRYRPELEPALDGIDLEIPTGKRIAVVGPSGAGKSTLVNILLRFWDGWNGDVFIDGNPLRDYSSDVVRKLFAVIAQSTYLFTGTVRHNLQLAKPDATEDEMLAALNLVGLSGWLYRQPEGLATWIGEQGGQLSGGERQRLTAARALLRNAPVFILDEPGTHLDAISEHDLVDTLECITRGKSALWITHRLIGLDRMDEVIVLDHGRIIERGSHAALIHAGGVYQRMYDSQNISA